MQKKTKVVLLGDSIRLLGYGKYVAEALGDAYEVWQPTENCRYAKYTQRLLFEAREQLQGADAVHFNCGLWDVYDQFCEGETFSTETEYCDTVCRIAAYLLRLTPCVVFATTTSVKEGHLHVRNGDVDAFNRAVVPRLRAMGVQIHDLGAFVREHTERFILDTDRIHLTDEGARACATRVAEAIRTALAAAPKP